MVIRTALLQVCLLALLLVPMPDRGQLAIVDTETRVVRIIPLGHLNVQALCSALGGTLVNLYSR